jgi:large subunit ribosomal protein L29
MARTTNSTRLDDMNLTELIDELRATKHEALNLRFSNATGQLDNTAEIKRVRRQIARINTLIRQREIAAAESTSGNVKS